GHLDRVQRLALQVAQAGAAHLHVEAWRDDVHDRRLGDGRHAVGVGDHFARLGAALLRLTQDLDAARLAGAEAAVVEIDLRPTGVYQPFGERRVDLDLLRGAVAGVGHRDRERGRLAGHHSVGTGGFHDELRLAHLDAHRRDAGEGDGRLRRRVAARLGD